MLKPFALCVAPIGSRELIALTLVKTTPKGGGLEDREGGLPRYRIWL